jgi:hypothetical protein
MVETGRGRNKFFADRTAFRRGLAVAHGTVDVEKSFSLRQGSFGRRDGIFQLSLP